MNLSLMFISCTFQIPGSIDMELDSADSSATSASAAIRNASSTFSEIDEVAGTNEVMLSEVNSSLFVLRTRLSQAVDAASMVCFSSVVSMGVGLISHDFVLV